MSSPQVLALGSKRRVLNGIAISASQPSSVIRVAAFQMPSQSWFRKRELLMICPSARAPTGLTWKKKPLR